MSCFVYVHGMDDWFFLNEDRVGVDGEGAGWNVGEGSGGKEGRKLVSM